MENNYTIITSSERIASSFAKIGNKNVFLYNEQKEDELPLFKESEKYILLIVDQAKALKLKNKLITNGNEVLAYANSDSIIYKRADELSAFTNSLQEAEQIESVIKKFRFHQI